MSLLNLELSLLLTSAFLAGMVIVFSLGLGRRR